MLKIVELQACAADGCECLQAMNCFASDRMQVHQAFDRAQQLAASHSSLQRLAVSQIDGQTWRRSETKQGLGRCLKSRACRKEGHGKEGFTVWF